MNKVCIIAHGNVAGLLIEAIKEQQKQIDKLIKDNPNQLRFNWNTIRQNI